MSKATERPAYLKRYIPTVEEILEETKQDDLTVEDRYEEGFQDGFISSVDQSDWSDHKRKDDPHYFRGYLAGLSAGEKENEERRKEMERGSGR